MVDCRICGKDLGEVKYNICKSCLDERVSEYMLRFKIKAQRKEVDEE